MDNYWYFERHGFEPCDSEPKIHRGILSGKTLPLEELSSQAELNNTFFLKHNRHIGHIVSLKINLL